MLVGTEDLDALYAAGATQGGFVPSDGRLSTHVVSPAPR